MQKVRRAVGVVAMLAWTLAGPVHGQYDPDAPEPVNPRPGSLLIAGSGELSPAAVERFAELARSGPRVLVVLLQSSAGRYRPDAVAGSDAWTDVRLVQVPSREEANDSAITATLADADAVWIPNQDGELARHWGDTRLARALERVIARRGVVGAHGAAVEHLGQRVVAPGAPDGLALMPGAGIVTGADLRTTLARLREFLPAHRELVGYAVPAGSTISVTHRRITTVAGGDSRALIAPWRGKPWRIEYLDDDHWMDLVLLSRAAASRLEPPFPPGSPPSPRVPHGTLILAGGAGVPDGLLQRFIRLAGGPDAPIVFIPPAGGQLQDEPATVERLRRAGATNVRWVHTADRNRANHDESILGPLREARGIWFGGGRHWRYVDSYQNTEAHRLMQQVLERGGVIAGGSAGASIQSDFMTRGDPRNISNVMAEGYERGLGFLQGTAIDQHFSQRNRLHDLALVVSRHPQLLGIGLDERTALIVRGDIGEVVADRPRDRVFFFGRNHLGSPIDQRYLALGDGERYDLVRRMHVRHERESSSGE